MKKLKLKNLELEIIELLSPEQLKGIFGGEDGSDFVSGSDERGGSNKPVTNDPFN